LSRCCVGVEVDVEVDMHDEVVGVVAELVLVPVPAEEWAPWAIAAYRDPAATTAAAATPSTALRARPSSWRRSRCGLTPTSVQMSA
jgi:hypothetical protein